MTKKAVNSEIERLRGILERAGVPEQKRASLDAVVFNLAMQKCKLEETAEMMYKEQVVCEYNNGNGQQGTHESPLFRGYNSLWKSYLAGLSTFTAALPKDLKDEVKQDGNTLAKVLQMKKRA